MSPKVNFHTKIDTCSDILQLKQLILLSYADLCFDYALRGGNMSKIDYNL